MWWVELGVYSELEGGSSFIELNNFGGGDSMDPGLLSTAQFPIISLCFKVCGTDTSVASSFHRMWGNVLKVAV